MKKRVFDQEKTLEIIDYDLELGKLSEDRVFIAHHEATQEVTEVSHEEIVAKYPNGGKDVRKVIDVPYQPAREAWDEYEDVYVYTPYTAEELSQRAEERYKAAIVTKIRQRYSLDDELAVHRQRETKPDEWKAYDTYCEECKAEARADHIGNVPGSAAL